MLERGPILSIDMTFLFFSFNFFFHYCIVWLMIVVGLWSRAARQTSYAIFYAYIYGFIRGHSMTNRSIAFITIFFFLLFSSYCVSARDGRNFMRRDFGRNIRVSWAEFIRNSFLSSKLIPGDENYLQLVFF